LTRIKARRRVLCQTWSSDNNQEAAMTTQHSLQEDATEDQKTLRRLGAVVGLFILATAAMALVIGVVMG
tara:strand:+ start:4267 stop:4473 length:207 start_codon:yes stop_codon:yes gene_type:complete